MSFGSQYNLNQRITYLEYIINQLAPQLPLDLDQILTNGNSAGTNDIDMNNNDILNVNNLAVSTINGSSYPPPSTPSSTVFSFIANTVSFSTPIGNGRIKWNSATQASATQLFVSHQDSGGDDIQVLLSALPIGTIILIQDQSSGSLYQKWEITSIAQVINQYITFGVTLIVSTHSFSNNDDVLFITLSLNQNLSQVLAVGNSAGAFSINLNNQNITNGNTITANNFTGLASSASQVNVTDSPSGTYYLAFATDEGIQDMRINKAPVALTYNASSNTIFATTFSGTATVATTATTATNSNNIFVSSDNTSGTYYIPFSKTSGTGNKALFQDDTTGPLSYNPSTSTLATNYIDIGNPYLFDDFETFLQSNGPFGWFNGTLTLGATRTLYTGALDATQSLNLPRRFGLLSCSTGGANFSDFVMTTATQIIRPANTKSITFGGVDCGTGTLASIATPSATNVTKSIGLYTTATPNADDTNANSIIWRRSSANTSATAWEFRVNNVLVTNGTGPNTADCNYFRVTIEFQLSGGNYQTRGIFTNLGPNNTGSFTSDWVNVPVNPSDGSNANFAGWHLLNNGDASARTIAMDYCLLQNNSFPINRGTTSALSR